MVYNPRPKEHRQLNLYGNIDAVITSPPYEESMGKKHHSPAHERLVEEKHCYSTYTDVDESVKRIRKHPRTDPHAGGEYGRSLAHPYSAQDANIGNLRGQSYLQAMLQVYQQCQLVLKPNGLMILVTKNFIRDKKVVAWISTRLNYASKRALVYSSAIIASCRRNRSGELSTMKSIPRSSSSTKRIF